jgi:hypothetical protein
MSRRDAASELCKMATESPAFAPDASQGLRTPVIALDRECKTWREETPLIRDRIDEEVVNKTRNLELDEGLFLGDLEELADTREQHRLPGFSLRARPNAKLLACDHIPILVRPGTSTLGGVVRLTPFSSEPFVQKFASMCTLESPKIKAAPVKQRRMYDESLTIYSPPDQEPNISRSSSQRPKPMSMDVDNEMDEEAATQKIPIPSVVLLPRKPRRRKNDT